MTHGLLGLAIGVVVGAAGAAILVDWLASRELAKLTDRFLAIDPQPPVVHIEPRIELSGEAAERAAEILVRRGKAQRR